MEKNNLTNLRLGDAINFPHKGELVGVHYTLRNEKEIIESTYEWGKPCEWRVGQASVIQALDDAVRKMSLGGRARLAV
jgi:FKBP-type peptidyl-prolyl cis-trans isomerase 2